MMMMIHVIVKPPSTYVDRRPAAVLFIFHGISNLPDRKAAPSDEYQIEVGSWAERERFT